MKKVLQTRMLAVMSVEQDRFIESLSAAQKHILQASQAFHQNHQMTFHPFHQHQHHTHHHPHHPHQHHHSRTDFSIDAIMGNNHLASLDDSSHSTGPGADSVMAIDLSQTAASKSAECAPADDCATTIDVVGGLADGSEAPGSPSDSSTASQVEAESARSLASAKRPRPRPKKYQCPYCWVALSNTGQLKGHVRIHTGERPFKCDHPSCQRTFTRNEELTRHKRIHSGQRPYACQQCSKRFGRKDHLKKHTRTHGKQQQQQQHERQHSQQQQQLDDQQDELKFVNKRARCTSFACSDPALARVLQPRVAACSGAETGGCSVCSDIKSVAFVS